MSTNSTDITGFMEPAELEWLNKQGKKYKKIVEIGCFLGRSTSAIARNTSGFVLAVDDFYGPRDVSMNVDGIDVKGKSPLIQHKLYAQFHVNLFDDIRDGRVIPLVSDHRSVPIDFVPDMVFIDGSHEYLDVLDDIRIWKDKIAKGGLICGHDIQFVDVERAVREVIGEFKVAKGTTIWYKILN